MPAVAPALRAREFVKSIPAELKAAVLNELVGEVIAAHPEATSIPLMGYHGEKLSAVSIATFTPPVLTAKDRADIQWAIDNPDLTFDPEELFEQLAKEDQD